MRLSMLVLLSLSACVSSATYADVASRAACDKLVECDAGIDQDECEQEGAAYLGCFEEHCETFDGKAASACISSLKDATCDDGADLDGGDCDQVWTDCSQLELAACLAATAFGG